LSLLIILDHIAKKWSRLSEQYISVFKWDAATSYAASVEVSELK
jgi:hypothetical protein